MAELTSALEDYLETILLLVQEQRHARVRDIAAARNVKPASVSPALKRLADLGLVEYVRREYVRLTAAGDTAARRVYARHQLLTRFFSEVLLMPKNLAEKEACALEHSLSAEGMERLTRFFEFITHCSNGGNFVELFRQCPLATPGAEGCSPECECLAIVRRDQEAQSMTILSLKPGETGRVSRVSATGPVRQRLLDLGLLPNVTVRMERVAPTGDPVWISLDGSHVALRKQEARAVLLD